MDALAVRYWDANGNGSFNDAGEVHYFSHDAQFNVTAVYGTTGSPVERYAYRPYGEAVVLNGSFTEIAASAIDNPYRFTGREYDSETGLHHFRYRYYHPRIGRFVSRDPVGYWDGMNLYANYWGVNRSDPLGLGTMPIGIDPGLPGGGIGGVPIMGDPRPAPGLPPGFYSGPQPSPLPGLPTPEPSPPFARIAGTGMPIFNLDPAHFAGMQDPGAPIPLSLWASSEPTPDLNERAREGGGRDNPDMDNDDLRDAYIEWVNSGRPDPK